MRDNDVDEMLEIDELKQWVFFGATWKAVRITDERVVVDLCSCSGEPVDRRESDDREVIEYVRQRGWGAPDR